MESSLSPAFDGLEYPHARRGTVVDDYHGVEVPDPYRWLEDPDAEATRAWVDEQNALSAKVLASWPDRAATEERLGALWRFERCGLPQRRGGRLFFVFNDGEGAQSVLCCAQTLSGPRTVLIDPTALTHDSTSSISGVSVSDDGNHVAYGISHAGADWQEWRILEVRTGDHLPETLRWIKFSGATWHPDGSGFFYSRYPEPDHREAELANQRLYFHRLGTEQSTDRLVYACPDEPRWGFATARTERTLAIQIWRSTSQRHLAIVDLDDPGWHVREVVPPMDGEATYVGRVGDEVLARVDLDAPLSRVVAIDVNNGEWRDVVPEATDNLVAAKLIGGRLVLSYIAHARYRVEVWSVDGTHLRHIPLPGAGTVLDLRGRCDATEVWLGFTSFVHPPCVLRFDVEVGETEVVHTPKVDFVPDDFVVRQVFFTSADGTRVPMTVAHRADRRPTGDNPALLSGYGGFNVPITPGFSVFALAWMERGGIYASANLRGGGEYGRDWHAAGTLERKQNVFDDFASAARWLVDQGWTTPSRLGILGGSNGGLLVGASIAQNPELFGAAVAQVGVLDMLRYHRFSIGWAWARDYGTVDDGVEMFSTLYAYSPYHNLEVGRSYPATLIMTGDHDDRVVPAHSYKFGAALQRAQGGPAPVLMRVTTNAGHGAGRPKDIVLSEWVDELAFLGLALGA